ncbi:MAG: serine hydrolase [Bacteroidota bacterium]
MTLPTFTARTYMFILSILFLSCKSNSSDTESQSNKIHTDKIDSLLVESYDKDQFNGNVLVVRNDTVLYQKSFGYLSEKRKVGLDDNSIFNIGSIAKQFNGVAILMLQERGLLNINDPLSKFELDLPDWSNKISIKHLLHYTSGLTRLDPLTPSNDKEAWEILRKSDSLLFEPQTRFLYDNANVFLQRRIIEKVSGLSYEDFIIENVVKPLNMEYSVHDPGMTHPNRTSCYGSDKTPCPELEFISGWLWVTTNDFYKWVKALNENTLISQESYNEILGNPYFKNENTYPYTYKATSPLGEYFEESEVQRHNGISYKFESILLNDLKNNMTIIVLSNYRGKVWSLGHSIHNILLDKPYKSIYEAIREMSIQNVDLGIKTYKELKEKHQDVYQFDNPGELNKLGYELLRMDKKEEAIKMFVLATSEFPDNANLFDSLAEGYFSNEQYDSSLQYYKKSLELNPENTNAQKMIEKINSITKK